MKKKKKKIKKRNGYAKALEHPSHRQRVIPDKRKKKTKHKKTRIEYTNEDDDFLRHDGYLNVSTWTVYGA